jgi:hypothetical protein
MATITNAELREIGQNAKENRITKFVKENVNKIVENIRSRAELDNTTNYVITILNALPEVSSRIIDGMKEVYPELNVTVYPVRAGHLTDIYFDWSEKSLHTINKKKINER